MTELGIEFQQAIEKEMKRQGMSKIKMAKLLNTNRNSICRWISDMDKTPFDKIQRMCNVLNIDMIRIIKNYKL